MKVEIQILSKEIRILDFEFWELIWFSMTSTASFMNWKHSSFDLFSTLWTSKTFGLSISIWIFSKNPDLWNPYFYLVYCLMLRIEDRILQSNQYIFGFSKIRIYEIHIFIWSNVDRRLRIGYCSHQRHGQLRGNIT